MATTGEKFINVNQLAILATAADNMLDDAHASSMELIDADDITATVEDNGAVTLTFGLHDKTKTKLTGTTSVGEYVVSNVRFVKQFNYATHIAGNYATEFDGATLDQDLYTSAEYANQPVLIFDIGTTDSEEEKYPVVIPMKALVDVFSIDNSNDSNKVLTIGNYTLNFNKSADADNALGINNDGLFVTTADKINTVSGANGQVGVFDSNGQLIGGVSNESIVTSAYQAIDSDIGALVYNVFGYDGYGGYTHS